MSKKTKSRLNKKDLYDIFAGTSTLSDYLYWLKIWTDTKTKNRSRVIISKMPKNIRPVPYSEGNFNVKFEGPYLTRDEALTKSSMGG